MSSNAMSPNHREALTAVSSITGKDEYVKSTNGAIDINGTIGGSALPISGATTGVGVAILDSSGNQISSFGGGTQYTDGGVPPAHPVGNTIEWNDGANWQTVSTAKPLPVTASISTAGLATSTKQSDGSQKTQIVDGGGNVIGATTNALDINIKSGNPTSITANAGTNLNTSALALETGGNLAAIKTDVDKIPSQGQALAAASMPVVLPAAQITTLTPPSNTGYALDATLTNGNQQVQGNVASAATDSGNPVKMGGKYLATKPTFTDGQRGDVQLGTRGSVAVSLFVSDSTTAQSFMADNANTVAASATANKMAVVSRSTVFNGTTWDLAPGDATNGAWVNVKAALPAGTALVGKVGIDQTTPGTTNAVVDTPVTSGGLSIITGSVGATATVIKASAGQLYGYHLFNTTAAVAYVQIFNVVAASVTLGTTVPVISIGIPASGGATVNFDKGIAFSTAISYACTTTRTGLTGATCDVNFFYK